jgi:hypothetical protein
MRYIACYDKPLLVRRVGSAADTKNETEFNLDNGNSQRPLPLQDSPALLDWRSGNIRFDAEF